MSSNSGSLVDLLCHASSDMQPEREDIQLVEAAEQWLLGHGWTSHWRMGFVNKARGVSFRDDEDGLVVCSQASGSHLWQAEGPLYRVSNMRQALNQLVVLELMPERFSTIGRNALRDVAEVFERAACRLAEEAGVVHFPHDLREADLVSKKAETLHEAAESARRLGNAGVLA